MTFKNTDLIDILDERHRQIRKACQTVWNQNYDTYISESEWLIMERSGEGTMTISDIARGLYITRQAAHKVVRNLEGKGLVRMEVMENNKRKKKIIITDLGLEYCEIHKEIKENLVLRIKTKIGADYAMKLEKALGMDWGMC